MNGKVGLSVDHLTRRGRLTMLAGTWATALCSLGFAYAYLAAPRAIQTSLLGVLTTSLVWSFIQLILGLGIIASIWPGGYHQRIAHIVGGVIQSVYFTLWLSTAIFLERGHFVWPPLLVVVVVHWALAGLQWPTREEVRRRGNVGAIE